MSAGELAATNAGLRGRQNRFGIIFIVTATFIFGVQDGITRHLAGAIRPRRWR